MVKDFPKAQCGAEAKAEPTPSSAPPPSAARPAKTIAAPGRRATRYFPLPFRPNTLVSPRAKRGCKLCLDQYRANKANGANGGPKWIEKGGGYYSECNKHLKG